MENNVQKCYDSVQDCINDGFEYLDGNECILECPSTKFKVNYIRGSNGKIINLGRCFVDQTVEIIIIIFIILLKKNVGTILVKVHII